MPTEFRFAFKVRKDWDCACPVSDEEAYLALVRCLAAQPSKMSELKDDETIRFVDVRNINPSTRKPKTFQVGWM